MPLQIPYQKSVFFQSGTAITKASVNGTIDNIQFPLFWHR